MSLSHSVRAQIVEVAANSETAPHVAANAVDGDTATKWRLTPPAALTVKLSSPVVAGRFAVTSGDDPTAYPAGFEVWGSPDGATWTKLTAQTSQTFTGTNVTIPYRFANKTAYLYYRLDITAGAATGVDIAEWDLAPADPPRLDVLADATASGSWDTTGTYGPTKAIDGDITTAWRSTAGTNFPFLTVVPTEPTAIQAYGIVCADPSYRMRSWHLKGFTPDTGWAIIDERVGQMFDSATPLIFTVNVAAAYSTYHIQVTELAPGSSAVAVHEVELYGIKHHIIAPPFELTTVTDNDRFADPDVVIVDRTGNTVRSIRWNSSYDIESGEPGSGYRSAWWRYTPYEDGTATFDTTGSQATTVLTVYTGGTLASLVEIASASGLSVSVPVTAGTTYRVRVAMVPVNTFASYVLDVTGPTTRPGLALPPMDTRLEVKFGVPAEVRVDAPPIDAELSTSASQTVKVAAPIMELRSYVSAAEITRARLTMLDPADGTLVPFTQPSLTTELVVGEGSATTATVEIHYSLSSAFATYYQPIHELTHTLDVMRGSNIIRLPVAAPLPEQTMYYWRARLIIDGVTLGWRPTQRFTVDRAAGDHTAQVTWSVSSGPTDPHLWYITPAAGVPGDLLTVIGQGFSDSRGTVEIAGVSMPVQSWTHMPPSGTAPTDQRVIDAMLNRVDPEHDEVVVVVPVVPPPGGPVVVVDGNGTIPPDKPPMAPVFAPALALEAPVGPFEVSPVSRPAILIDLMVLGLDVTVPEGQINSGNIDNFSNLGLISLPGAGGTVVCAPVSNVGYTLEIDESGKFPGYRSAWWGLTLDPGEWSLTVDATGSDTPVWVDFCAETRPGSGNILDLNILRRAPAGANPDPIIANTTRTAFYGDANKYLIRVAAVDDVDATYSLSVAAAKLWSPSGPPPVSGTNDSFASPDPVTFDNAGTVVFYPTSNTGYTVGSDEPPPDAYFGPAPGYRSAWWKVSVTAGGYWSIACDAAASSTPVHIGVYHDLRADGYGVDEVSRAPDPGSGVTTPATGLSFTGPSTFLVRVSSDEDVDATYNLTVTLTATVI